MSGTNAGHQPHTNQEATPGQKPSDDNRGPDVPSGYEVDHHDPDEFSVRCTSCGHLETYSSRARAHRKADHHGLECSPTGVTPLTELDQETDGRDTTCETDRCYCGRFVSFVKYEKGAYIYECGKHGRIEWGDLKHSEPGIDQG